MEERNGSVNWESLSDLTAPDLGALWILCCVVWGLCPGVLLVSLCAWVRACSCTPNACGFRVCVWWKLENSTFVCLACHSSVGLSWWICLIKCLEYGLLERVREEGLSSKELRLVPGTSHYSMASHVTQDVVWSQSKHMLCFVPPSEHRKNTIILLLLWNDFL